jgi:hypothetical protein
MVKHQQYKIGDRVDKLCAVCQEELGHVVASLNKQGRISRLSCSQCGTHSTFKSDKIAKNKRSLPTDSAPYDWTRTYRKGQTMLHPTFGLGEVMAVIEPKKIDVLFSDRVRRLVHARASV